MISGYIRSSDHVTSCLMIHNIKINLILLLKEGLFDQSTEISSSKLYQV